MAVIPIASIVFDCENPGKVAEFWAAVTGYTLLRADEEFGYLGHPDKIGPTMMFFKVPESKVTKNRMHMDLYIEDLAAEIARLTGLGATKIADHTHNETNWAVMQDIEGNEFCVVKP